MPPIHDAVDPVAEETKPTEEIDESIARAESIEHEVENDTPEVDADATNHERDPDDPDGRGGPPKLEVEIPADVQEEIDAWSRKVGSGDPSPIETLPSRKRFRHKVVPRERFVQVAHRYGMTTAELAERNGLSGVPDKLRRGARLEVFTARVPPHQERLDYEVQEGDTWYSIALRHGVDKRDLRSINYPWKGKLAPGSVLELWVDPIVRDWIAAGDDPLPDDDAVALRRGAVGIGPPDAGWLINGVRIPKGDGYRLRLPKSAYGTSHAVAQILIGLSIFRATTDYPLELQLGAMSRPRGGALGHHLSHQTGRDLDIRLPRRRDVASWTTLTMRRIDWLAHARTGEPVIKQFRTEEDVVLRLLVDASASLDFGDPSKGEVARRLAAALAYMSLASSQRAQVHVAGGAAARGSGLDRIGAPRRGRGALAGVLRELIDARPGGAVELSRAIDQTTQRASRPGMLVVISDFFDAGPVLSALGKARAAGHDIFLVQVLAREEVEPSFEGDFTLEDSETGDTVDVTMDPDAIDAYVLRLTGLVEALRAWARRHGGTYVRAVTDEPLEGAVRRCVAREVD